MRSSRAGECHVYGAVARLVTRLRPLAKVAVVCVFLGACAKSHDTYGHRSNVGVTRGAEVAAMVRPKIEIEADGLAAQTPPRRRRPIEPDDPNEPFSPNYGPPPISSEPVDVPPVPRRQANAEAAQLRIAMTPISPEQAGSIVARAMVEHERRYP